MLSIRTFLVGHALLGEKQEHRQKLVKGYQSVPLDVMMAETGCFEIRTPAFVHKLLDRAEWKGHPEALKAIENEKQGLLANGTWDEPKVRPKSKFLVMARSSGTKIHIGFLMVIGSINGYEKPSSERTVKARIVFRGDAVRDDENQAAIFDEIAASAPTSLGGLNLNLIVAYGLLRDHKTSTSDCVTAYAQSLLCCSRPTHVLLPIELVPEHAKHIHQPCAPLVKSLYGHPLASASWQNHLSKVLAKDLGGFKFEERPSCFYVPKLQLALSVYVDDLTLSGPSANHSKF